MSQARQVTSVVFTGYASLGLVLHGALTVVDPKPDVSMKRLENVYRIPDLTRFMGTIAE
jgi:hypothetical protein